MSHIRYESRTTGRVPECVLSLPKVSALRGMLMLTIRWLMVMPVFLLVILAGRIAFNVLTASPGDLTWWAHLLMVAMLPSLAVQIASSAAPCRQYETSVVLASILILSLGIVAMLSVASLFMNNPEVPRVQCLIGILSGLLGFVSTFHGCLKMKTVYTR